MGDIDRDILQPIFGSVKRDDGVFVLPLKQVDDDGFEICIFVICFGPYAAEAAEIVDNEVDVDRGRGARSMATNRTYALPLYATEPRCKSFAGQFVPGPELLQKSRILKFCLRLLGGGKTCPIHIPPLDSGRYRKTEKNGSGGATCGHRGEWARAESLIEDASQRRGGRLGYGSSCTTRWWIALGRFDNARLDQGGMRTPVAAGQYWRIGDTRLRGFAANHENRSEIRRGNWADRFQPSTSLGGSERLSSKPLRELRAVNGDDRTLNEGV